MKDLRRNEFIDMLEMAGITYNETKKLIHCKIPFLSRITYNKEKNNIYIDKTDEIVENGYDYIKNILNKNVIIENYDRVVNKKSEFELRNEFAGLAMQGFISNAVLLELISGNNGLPNPEYVAKLSYELSKEMVKRSKL